MSRSARVLAGLVLLAALAAEEVVLTVRERTELCAASATIADVAAIRATPELAAILGRIPVADLATAPVTVDAHLLTALAARAAAPATIRVEGSGTVVRRMHSFSVDDLAAAAGAAAGDAVWRFVRASGALTAPEGPGLALAAEPLDPLATGDVPFRVRALDGGREVGRALVVLHLERHGDVVVATRDLARGEVLAAADLRAERRNVDRGNAAAVVDPMVLVGSVAKRELRAGEPVSPALVALAPVVRAGAVVQASWPGRGFDISFEATALADARAGGRLGLRRVHDGAILRGTARPDGTVVVER